MVHRVIGLAVRDCGGRGSRRRAPRLRDGAEQRRCRGWCRLRSRHRCGGRSQRETGAKAVDRHPRRLAGGRSAPCCSPSHPWSVAAKRPGRVPTVPGGARRGVSEASGGAGLGPVTGPKERPLTAKPAFDPTTVTVERPLEPPRLADQPRLQRRLHHLAAGDFDAVGGGTGT